MSHITRDPRMPTVMVVEDEFLVRELAVCQLEEVGFRVVDFATADAALLHLTAHHAETDVVFTDVQMPGNLNGLELVDIISRCWPDLAVLVTSGGAVVNPAVLPPSVRFVAKPWRGADIVKRLTRMADAAAGLRAV